MTEWKRICCAVDFEEPSRAAMAQAADLAARLEAELTLVHALAPPTEAASDVLVSSRGLARAEADEHEATLARWRADAERRVGRPVPARVLWGEPTEEIVRYAREQRCDVLVLGTHGRTGMSRLVLGSVAERVARRAPCPVLVVHDHEALEGREVAEEAGQYR
jgi:nucleotide-binding universal stress UspA family protein